MANNKSNSGFVVYVGSADAESDLQRMKIYEVTTPEANDPTTYLRVIDDSGEDYLYPAKHFVPLRLPTAAQRKLHVLFRAGKPRVLSSPRRRVSA